VSPLTLVVVSARRSVANSFPSRITCDQPGGCRKSRPRRSGDMFIYVDDPAETIAPADVEGGDRVWIGDRGGQRV
jgi:hypothetical protein